MKIQEYDLLKILIKTGYKNQRTLSELSGYSLGKVNQSLAVLIEEGYLDGEYTLTAKAFKELEEKRPQNAVILAAGYGMRMVPVNRERPKGLIEIEGEALIERLIRQLQEAGIRDVTIVVGYMKEYYEYLMDKYEVKLVFNRNYATKNNLHSLQLVKEKLGNTYILPCDIWCAKNPFSNQEWYSWYMVTDLLNEESNVRVNRKLELVLAAEEENGNSMIGISYLLKDEAEKVKERLGIFSKDRHYENSFWEETLFEKKKMMVSARVISSEEALEVNTYEQLRELDEESRQMRSGILQTIAKVLKCSVNDITQIRTLKKGMTNRTFQFECRGKKYIMRVPGEGTELFLKRREEYDVYQKIADLDLSDKIQYFDLEKGYKLTEVIENVQECNPNDKNDVKRCMEMLRRFHKNKLEVNHTFNIFDKIEFYESLWAEEASCYKDYFETKTKIYELKKFIDEQPKEWKLCHIDAVYDNFLIGTDTIKLIDWEYAGMQDPHVDIAMFIIHAMYEKEQADEVIDYYFEGECTEKVRLKIYSYIACCGLLWSNWCEYKRMQGFEFGEYSIRQYRYAKEYYRYVKNALK